jgi:hypothetical protein
MKSHFRFYAAVVIAVILSLPSLSLAAQPRERGSEKNPIVRIIQKIRKFVGIGSHDDFPVPPIPPKP